MSERARSEGFTIHQRCKQQWDERARVGGQFHCAQCDSLVRDVSSMTYAQYTRWLAEREARGPECVTVRLDDEGRIILRDEPAVKRRLPVVATAAALVTTIAAAPGCERRAPAQAPVERAPEPDAGSAPIAVAPEAGPAIDPNEHPATAVATEATDSAADAAAPPAQDASGPTREPAPGAIVDAGRVVRVLHPHPPGQHRRNPRPRHSDQFEGFMSIVD